MQTMATTSHPHEHGQIVGQVWKRGSLGMRSGSRQPTIALPSTAGGEAEGRALGRRDHDDMVASVW